MLIVATGLRDTLYLRMGIHVLVIDVSNESVKRKVDGVVTETLCCLEEGVSWMDETQWSVGKASNTIRGGSRAGSGSAPALYLHENFN